ncbi:MAG: UDP-4-amino-4,6-dideoxy-N-acetyl-beta-L-altrosamine N-acetyltransferase [Caulobacteraceae bacterium]|nr:UDP-4-amino-4,6-dideoxy-N-acetyl-beta-L-altrosamine N-acetyltransferase [Caulobacteraceae bacterium]
MIDLRPLSEDDCERLFRWRREPEVDRWMSDLPALTLDEHRRWFDEFRGDPDRRGWIITHNSGPAGFLTLTGLRSRHRRADWGWYIGDAAARGRGAGRAAQALGLDLAFDGLGLEKVCAEVLADNDVALKAQAAAGFRREGYRRRHVLKDGVFRDVVLLAILAEEWRERREQVRRGLATANLIAA